MAGHKRSIPTKFKIPKKTMTLKPDSYVRGPMDIQVGDITNVGVVTHFFQNVFGDWTVTIDRETSILALNVQGTMMQLDDITTNWSRIERICIILLKRVDVSFPFFRSYLDPLSAIWNCDLSEAMKRCKDAEVLKETIVIAKKKQDYILKKKMYEKFGL